MAEATYDVAVLGGGPAGLAAALAAEAAGTRVLLLEREGRLGGILKQCIHDGFGLVRFGRKMAGPEYAQTFIDQIAASGVEVALNSFVTHVRQQEDGVHLTVVTAAGLRCVQAKALVLATGCRERTARQVAIHGTRPAGVFTAGAAQHYTNLLGKMPGKRCVVLGSGDIGLIMARRLTLEGGQVLGVYEAKPAPSGLARNISQCLTDFGIPLYTGKTVTRVFGRQRLEAVEISDVDGRMAPIPGTQQRLDCDCLILSVGLIPENELTEQAGIEISKGTHGAVVTEDLQTSAKGFFACGNVLHVHDLVDFVATEAEEAGVHAAKYIQADTGDAGETIIVENGDGAGAVCPQMIHRMPKQDKVALMFRPRNKFRDVTVSAESDGKVIAEKKLIAVTPGEMIRLEIPADKLAQAGGAITVSLKGGAL